jgi:hypothetical protein
MTEPFTDARGLKAHIGKRVDVCGRYDLWDLGPHRVLVDLPDGRVQTVRQIVNLVLEDDAVVRLWVRPDAEMKALDGARVVVRGTLFAGEPPDALVSAPADTLSLLDIERVEAA